MPAYLRFLGMVTNILITTAKANSEKIQSTNSKSQSGTNTNLTLQIIININYNSFI